MGQLVIIFLVFLSSCAGVLSRRSVIHDTRYISDYFVPGEDFEVIPGDKGFYKDSPINNLRKNQLAGKSMEQRSEYNALVKELRDKENKLTSSEYRYYSSVRPHLETVSEKIYYLNLSAYDKQNYISAKKTGQLKLMPGYAATYRGSNKLADKKNRKISSSRPTFPINVADSSRENLNIGLGMTKEDIYRRWGRPNSIDIAGDPRYQNERWSFYRNGKVQQVFFYGGYVEGWKLD